MCKNLTFQCSKMASAYWPENTVIQTSSEITSAGCTYFGYWYAGSHFNLSWKVETCEKHSFVVCLTFSILLFKLKAVL